MGMIEKFFTGKTANITSSMIRDELARAESEITTLGAKIGSAMDGIATMTDEQHLAAEANVASLRRSITRLESRIATLDSELPAVIAAEEAATKAEGNAALIKCAADCRKANSKEAKALLSGYDELAVQMGNILARLEAIDSERDAVNEALRANPVAESVVGYSDNYRKHSGREASERRELRLVWVHGNGKVEVAHLDQAGNPIKADRIWNHMKQGYEDVNLEQREVVVESIRFRPARYENPLSAIHLPPGFANGASHWPLKS